MSDSSFSSSSEEDIPLLALQPATRHFQVHESDASSVEEHDFPLLALEPTAAAAAAAAAATTKLRDAIVSDDVPKANNSKSAACHYELLSSDSDDSFDANMKALQITSKTVVGQVDDDQQQQNNVQSSVLDAWETKTTDKQQDLALSSDDDDDDGSDDEDEVEENEFSRNQKGAKRTAAAAKEQPPAGSAWVRCEKSQTYSFTKTGGALTWPDFCMPAAQYDTLYEHQRSGVQFLARLHAQGVGGILGDDMGMGKTRLTLAFLGGLYQARQIRSALIVAPVSVLRSWEKEASVVFAQQPTLRVSVFVVSSTISKQRRGQLLRSALVCSASRPALMITTYGMVRENTGLFSHHGRFFDYAILDEGHTIKNPVSAVSLACRAICGNNTHRLLLSGTPIMNNLRELWAVFDWATHGRVLGDLKDFTRNFQKVIEGARDADASDGMIKAGGVAAARLQELLKPHFLQRLKIDYLADLLPTKTELVLWTHLSDKQRTVYQNFVNDRDGIVRAVLLGETSSPLTAITWLKKLCGHPLLIEHPAGGADGNALLEDALHDLSVDEILASSAKLSLLVDLVHQLTVAGHKTLIFSQSTRMLDVIQRVLNTMAVDTARIDGSTHERDRQSRVDDFNNDGDHGRKIDAMLLSTKAAGVGLTLTGADRVIVFDPSWTPSEDSQAVDRCYRIGQTKPVIVYRMIAAGTVEEKMYEKQIYKDGIRRTVFTEGTEQIARYFDRHELRQLFTLGEPGTCAVMGKIQDVQSDWSDYSYLLSHAYVVGLSRHDGFYMVDNDSEDEAIEQAAIDLLDSDNDDDDDDSLPESALFGGSKEKAYVVDDDESSMDSNETASMDNEATFSFTRNGANGKENGKQKDPMLTAATLLSQGKARQSLKVLLTTLENDADTLTHEQLRDLHQKIAIQGHNLGLSID